MLRTPVASCNWGAVASRSLSPAVPGCLLSWLKPEAPKAAQLWCAGQPLFLGWGPGASRAGFHPGEEAAEILLCIMPVHLGVGGSS